MFPNFSRLAHKYPRRAVVIGALTFLSAFALYVTFFCSEMGDFTKEKTGAYKNTIVEFTGVVTARESFAVVVEKNNIREDGTIPATTRTDIVITSDTEILKTAIRDTSFEETDVPKVVNTENPEDTVQKESNLQIVSGTIDDIVIGSEISVTERVIEDRNGQSKEVLQIMIFPDSVTLVPST